jgi:hypothetical protein
MENPLNKIYQQYKQNPQKLSTHGLPEPIIDEDNTPDISRIRSCPKCGGVSLSFDIATNKTVCNNSKCKESTNVPNRIDWNKQMDEMLENERKGIEEALKRGDTFL